MAWVRPWGNYEVLMFADGYQVKVINVNAGKRLSLQTHEHRSEHWIVVSGTGKAIVDVQEFDLIPGTFLYIPKKIQHRISAITDLVIVEVQLGDYLGEDDIIRLDDDYGRVV